MNYVRALFAVMFLGLVVGCGTGPADNPVDVNAPSPEENIKEVLNGIIESGQSPGSGGYTIQQEIEAIKADDPAKAAKLQPLYDEIITLNNPSQLKAKAKEMLEIL